jgi:phage gp36-like protein
MAFLNKADLATTITLNELNNLADDLIISLCCDAAVGEMKLYLYEAYETDAIFNQTEHARNMMLLKIGADIAVYLIASAKQAGVDMDDRRKRYDRAVTILKQLKNTELYSELPRRQIAVQSVVEILSNPKRNNSF